MSRTPISKHKQDGKKLLPPFAQHGYSLTSWQDERLQHMLWATVLAGNLPRPAVLEIFRQVGMCAGQMPEEINPDVSHLGLAKMPPEYAAKIVGVITSVQHAKELLSSILHYKDLPAKEIWASAVGGIKVGDPDTILMRAVGATLWHQTQQATDCRWCRVLGPVLAGKMQMPQESFKKITKYPHEGDMSDVRPMIRCEELQLAAAEKHFGQAEEREKWSQSFWVQNLESFPCFPLLRESSEPAIQVGTTLRRIDEVYGHLVEHARSSRTDSGVNAKHDTTFGMGLYSLAILRELLSVGNCNSIVGRLGLRTLLDCYVTLAYLTHKDKPDLWKSHRVFGAGQAKLSSSKLEELKSEKCFADSQTLNDIANEDVWEEFLPINIGHWENSTLRREAVEAGIKADYDKYYAWTSSFSHAHWGSIRESVFITCGNPLHRLHRIPRPSCKILPDVLPNACQLGDKILGLISKLYPTFVHRL